MSEDLQVVEALRDGVARLDDTSGISVASAAGAGRRRRRRRAAGRVGVAVSAAAAVLAGVVALGLSDGVPLLSSEPPAGSATLEPAPPTNLDDAALMRPVVEEVMAGAGVTLPRAGFSVGYAAEGEDPLGLGGGVVARGTTLDGSVGVSAVHLDRGVDVDSVACALVAPRRPDSVGCALEEQPDGSVLVDVSYDSGAHELTLVHRDGWVGASGDDLDTLRRLVLDTRLRW